MKLGNSVASKWGQEMLPKIKAKYKGKVLWKVGLGVDPQIQQINFKGYDILGIDFTAPAGPEAQSLSSFPSIVSGAIDNAGKIAKRDAVPEIILAEVGVWGGALNFSEEAKTRIHRLIFEQGKDRVSGFIILDPPPDLGGWTIKNSQSLEEIKTWFGKL
jgi:5,10-methenyltetrahydromethanopterin hydrogenase